MCDFCIRLEQYKTKKSWVLKMLRFWNNGQIQMPLISKSGYEQAIVRMQRPKVYDQRIMGSALWMFMPIILTYAQKNTPRS